MLRQFLTILSILFLLYFSVGCDGDSKEVSSLYNQYKFDTNVVGKLPMYDSLVAAILEKSSFFQQHLNQKEDYRYYRYMPLSNERNAAREFPREVGSKINYYYNKLGNNFIYGFDIFKDSTIKVYIRRIEPDTSLVNILEHLSYYPSGTTMQKRTFPVKDTLLNDHWQYWIFFDKPRIPL